MNTTFRNLLILAGFTMVFAACNKDRLQVDPVNQFLSSNYYQTEEQVSNASLVPTIPSVGPWHLANGFPRPCLVKFVQTMQRRRRSFR